ncbi:MAG: hypothetical protein WBV47_10225, partial [Salegentibacter sp.]
MGKITPRIFFLTVLSIWSILVGHSAISKNYLGPEKPAKSIEYKSEFYFIGFLWGTAPTIVAPADITDAEADSGKCSASGLDLGT